MDEPDRPVEATRGNDKGFAVLERADISHIGRAPVLLVSERR